MQSKFLIHLQQDKKKKGHEDVDHPRAGRIQQWLKCQLMCKGKPLITGQHSDERIKWCLCVEQCIWGCWLLPNNISRYFTVLIHGEYLNLWLSCINAYKKRNYGRWIKHSVTQHGELSGVCGRPVLCDKWKCSTVCYNPHSSAELSYLPHRVSAQKESMDFNLFISEILS